MEPEVLRTRELRAITVDDTLEDVIRTFHTVREWSCEMDEQVRAEGERPAFVSVGMPVAQVDAMLVILEREQLQHVTDAAAAYAWRKTKRFLWSATALQVALGAWHVVMILLRK